MRKLARYIITWLGILTFSVGTPLVLSSQNLVSNSKTRAIEAKYPRQLSGELLRRVQILERAIREAKQKVRPKDVLRALGELEQLAEAQQSIGTLLLITELRYDSAQEIDENEAQRSSAAAYERLAGLPWLTSEARVLVRINQLHYYLEAYEDVHYLLDRVRPSADGADEVFPYKSKEGYTKRCLDLLGEIGRLAPLSASVAPYEPWAELKSLIRTRGGGWRGTLASELFARYDDDDGLIRSQMLALLERYIEGAKTPSEQMHATWARLNMLPKATEDDYLAFFTRYEQLPEAFAYLRSALDNAYLYTKKRSPRLYVAHLYRLMSLPYLSAEQRKRLEEREEELTHPSLYAQLRYPVTVPSKRKTDITLSHAFVRSVVVEAFRLPQIVDRPEDWKPTASDRPQWMKIYALEQDPEWLSKTDTLRLDLDSTGYYCLRITSPEMRERQPILLHLPVTDRVAYQPPHTREVGRMQWLDAASGAPALDVLAQSWENAWSKGQWQRRDLRTHQTDALGFVSIEQGKEGRAGSWVVRLEDREDPIFAALPRWYEGAWGEGYTAAMLTTDRAVYAEGQVWGVASARYSLPITEDTASGDVLRAVRRYYHRIEVEGKQQLVELHGGEALSVGDVLVVRLEITLDRAMDFVRLSDPRLACAEGREARSGYVYSSEARVSYYLEHRHEATNFYFDQLERGQYLLEYEQSVVRPGVYQAPSAHLQSVYVPEYTASTGFGGRIRAAALALDT